MRILHLADIHIGVENYGRPATESDLEAMPDYFAPGVDRKRTYLGLSTRLLDFLVALDEAVEFATEQSVDLVLFAGDAYKSRDPSQTHQREFAGRIVVEVQSKRRARAARVGRDEVGNVGGTLDPPLTDDDYGACGDRRLNEVVPVNAGSRQRDEGVARLHVSAVDLNAGDRGREFAVKRDGRDTGGKLYQSHCTDAPVAASAA